MKKRYTLYAPCYLLVFLFLITACAAAPQKTEEKKIAPAEKIPTAEKKLPLEEQEKRAVEIFSEILSLTERPEERRSALPQIEALYEEIINNCPDVTLAEESYWRLITMIIEEFKPPKIERAEKLYQDFLKRFPNSSMKIYIEQAFGQFYSTNKMWNNLLNFFIPQIKKSIESIKTGRLDNPYYIFMYSEAKFNLGDLIEAEKGYKIVIEFFPGTKEGEVSKDRLKEIEKLKRQTPTKGSPSGGT